MYRSNSKKKIENEQKNLDKIKVLKNDIDKLTTFNSKKLSDLAEMNSQMPPLVKHSNNYNEVLMKMPEFVKKKGDHSQ